VRDERSVGCDNRGRRERRLLAVVTITLFAFGFQQLSVVPTLPAMQHDLGTSTAWATWIITVFLLVGATTMPLLAKLADEFGGRVVLQGTLAVFAVTSVGAACAPGIATLIAFRAAAGVSAVFVALSVSLVSEHVRKERATRALSTIMVVVATTNIIAVVTAPLLADLVSWRAMFAVAAVAAALALALSVRWLPRSAPSDRARIDLPGALLLGLAIALLMLALTEANEWGWGAPPTLALFAASLAAAAAWIAVERRVPAPMIDLRLLTRRPVLLTNAAVVIAGFVSFALLVLVPRLVVTPRGLDVRTAALVDYGFGASSSEAGLYVLVAMLAGLAGGLSIGAVTRRVSWKWPLVAGLVLYVVGTAGLAVWHDERWQLVVAMLVVGYGIPIGTLVGAKISADSVRPGERALASGITVVAHYIGGVIGAQVCAAVLSADTIPGTAVPSGSAYASSFGLCALVGLVGVPLAILIHPRRHRDRTRLAAVPEAR
jgi:predicted MFS family arabinose efflux permease